MADTPDEPTRDPTTGRYLNKHGASSDDQEPEAPEPASPEPVQQQEENGKKRWLLLLLLLLLIALLLLCAGFAYNKWWGKQDPEPAATATPTPAATATATAKPSPTPSPSPSPTPSVKVINMPDVVGMPAPDAKTILEGAGFTNVKFINEGKDGDELKVLISYTVTKQSAAAGTQVPADTVLTITCKPASNGKG